MGKRYLISRKQLVSIATSLVVADFREMDIINQISTKQEVFSTNNNILLDVGFTRGLWSYSKSKLWKR